MELRIAAGLRWVLYVHTRTDKSAISRSTISVSWLAALAGLAAAIFWIIAARARVDAQSSGYDMDALDSCALGYAPASEISADVLKDFRKSFRRRQSAAVQVGERPSTRRIVMGHNSKMVPRVRCGSSTSLQAQAAHFRLSPRFRTYRCVAPLGDQSADARQGAAVVGELRQAAGAAARAAPDKRGVTRLQPHISRQSAKCSLDPQFRSQCTI
jgi:hypothetical protein